MGRQASWVLALLALTLVVAGCGSSATTGADPSPNSVDPSGHETSVDAGSGNSEQTEGQGKLQDASLSHRETGTSTTSSFTAIRIACGQSSPITDPDGNVWSADVDFAGGTPQTSVGVTVAGTGSPAVYAGQRYGETSGVGSPFRYNVPVPPGDYTVVLKFDEGYFTTGGRVFNVAVNGSQVLDNFDIYQAAGGATFTAVDRSFAVKVGTGGTIAIDFSPVVQDPKIDAIQITAGASSNDGRDAGPVDEAGPGAKKGEDAGATHAAKVLAYLSNLKNGTQKRLLSGQHAEMWDGDSVGAALTNTTPLASETGQTPAILGVVMNYVGNSGCYDMTVGNALANEWWGKGGLVELSIWSDDPTFSSNANGYPNGASISAAAFHQLTDTSSAAYKQWHSQLDTYAAELHTLTDSGNVVLLRPFIELNGSWNWYGAQDPSDFIFVWKDMYDYLMKTKGLVDVLWIYNVNTDVGRYSDYYPGASYVDIVGMDIYDDAANYVADANNGGMYSFLVSTGKPLILPEVGMGANSPPNDTVDNSALIGLIQASLPDVVGFAFWAGDYAINSQHGASALLNNAWVVNLADVPAGI